ncbi:MAG: J domain-containing protein [Verrucomicrobiota bacterium]
MRSKPVSPQRKKKSKRDPLVQLRSNYKRAQTQLDKVIGEWCVFQDKDVPEWRAWYSEHLGPYVEELEELQRKGDVIHRRVTATRMHMALEPSHSPAEAFREVWRREEAGEPLVQDEGVPIFGMEDMDPFQEREDPFEGMPASVEELGEDPALMEMVDGVLDRMISERSGGSFGDLSEDEQGRMRAQFLETAGHLKTGNRQGMEKAMIQLFADDSSENKKRVKELYRKLAKKLHPDHHPEATERETYFWNKVQEAYEAKCARSLEILEMRYRMDCGERPTKTDVPLLEEGIEEMREERMELREDLREAKGDPAWEFRLKPDEERERLKEELVSAIAEDTKALEKEFHELVELEERLTQEADLMNPAKRGTSPRRTKGKRRARTRAEEEQAELFS